MQRLNPYILFFLLTPISVSAESPCDIKTKDNIIYEGKIDSVRLISESVEDFPNIKDIKKCVMSIEARVGGKWYPSKGEYMFGPDMSQMDACSLAEDRAKKDIMREIVPETLKSEKSLKCDLTNVRYRCKVVYMNTSIGKVKFMENCEK